MAQVAFAVKLRCKSIHPRYFGRTSLVMMMKVMRLLHTQGFYAGVFFLVLRSTHVQTNPRDFLVPIYALDHGLFPINHKN